MADLLRLSITGRMPSGEEWSVNPVYSVGGDFGVPVSSAQALTIATACAGVAVPAGLIALNVPDVTVAGVRVEARSMAGVLESQAEVLKTTATPGSATNGHSFQSSLVISLRTGTPGARGRGRLYWPATGVPIVATTLRVNPTNLGTAIGAAKTYLSALETAIETTLTGVALAVWSRTTPALHVVTSIQGGDVLDVQRRRRDAALESYTATPYP